MPRQHDQIESKRYLNRRQWLSMLGVGSTAAIAGCLGGGDGDDGEDGEDGEDGSDGSDGEDGSDGSDGSDGGDGSDGEDGSDGDDEMEIPDVQGSYITAQSSGFETLNPLYNNENSAATAIGRTLDQGYTFDENGEYFPQLYDMSTEDGKVWTFEVRDGLEFSDPYGQVTAETFVYQIQELHQTDWGNTPAATDWQSVTVEQTGEMTFQAELENANLLWPETYAPLLYPIPIDIMQPYVEDEDAQGLEEEQELLELGFTGNLGPFTLDEWERSAGTTYSRNEDYYLQDIDEGPELFQNAPYFESAEIRIISEQSSRLGALETGEITRAAVPPERVSEYDSKDGLKVLQQPQPYNTGGLMAVNMRDNGWNAGPGNLFTHIPFRQALASAINKRDLIEGIRYGFGESHFTWQPRFSEWYPGDDNLTLWGVEDNYGEDVAKELAREAFEMSDHDYGFDGGQLVGPDGNQVSLELYALAGSETRIQTGEFIRDELADNLGIDVSVESIEGVTFANNYWRVGQDNIAENGITREINGEEVTWDGAVPGPSNPGPREFHASESWDMSIIYGLNTYPLNPLTNQAFFDGVACSYNPVGYYQEFDGEAIFDQMRNATERSEIQEAANELFQNINEEMPYITLMFPDGLPGMDADLVGPSESFFSGWDFGAWHFDR